MAAVALNDGRTEFDAQITNVERMEGLTDTWKVTLRIPEMYAEYQAQAPVVTILMGEDRARLWRKRWAETDEVKIILPF